MEKLNPRFVGPFLILVKIGPVAYKLTLPSKFSGIHNVFHVSMLREYVHNPLHIIDFQDMEVHDDQSIEDRSVQITDHRDQVLRGKTIPLERGDMEVK